MQLWQRDEQHQCSPSLDLTASTFLAQQWLTALPTTLALGHPLLDARRKEDGDTTRQWRRRMVVQTRREAAWLQRECGQWRMNGIETQMAYSTIHEGTPLL